MERNATGFTAGFASARDGRQENGVDAGFRRTGPRTMAVKEGTMQAEAKRMNGVQALPVSELLACPPETGTLLTASAQSLRFSPGDIVFRQGAASLGLYLVISGQLMRRAERMEMRIVLGRARPGDLVELAASLGDGLHTYSLVAQVGGSLLLLPKPALLQAFEVHPPLRMRLLEELAREVSRAYYSTTYASKPRRRRLRGSQDQ